MHNSDANSIVDFLVKIILIYIKLFFFHEGTSLPFEAICPLDVADPSASI